MIHDISPPLTPSIAVWPGDTPLSRELLADIARGDNLTLSTLHATVHLGAHADAPSHYGANAPTIGERPLEPYLGPCQVIDARVPRGSLLGLAQFPAEITAPRLLFSTGTFPDPERFNEDFAAFDPALLTQLADRGVRLVGIDTPSVDPFSSKDLPAHHVALDRDLCLLEGLVLLAVPPGNYELIALPLRLTGFDASPVRAVLRSSCGKLGGS